ncbi:MAG: Ig-like domain-containing protein [Planctomycetota bacterium]
MQAPAQTPRVVARLRTLTTQRLALTLALSLLTTLASAAPPPELTSPTPEPNNGSFGIAVAFVGDVNNDGFDDFIVGARGEAIPAGGSTSDAAGSAHLLSGADGSLIITHTGENPGDAFGAAVAGRGDFDGDGTSDYAVGAPSADPGGLSGAGTAYIYSGATHALLHRIDGAFASGRLGTSLDFVGNIIRDEINGPDTFDDLVVGAPGSSSFANPRVFIVGQEIDATLTAVVIATSVPRNTGDRRYGQAVAGVGDYDGDGVPDVGIGAPSSTGFNDFFTNRGRAYVYSGATILSTRTKLLAMEGVTGANQELFGASIASAGNFDGTGSVAVVIGASGPNSSAGAVEVLSHVSGSLIGARLLRVEGFAPNHRFGAAVAAAGEVNGDGFDDIIAGGSGASTGNFPGGEAFVISGASSTGVVENLQTTTRAIFAVSDVITIGGGDSVGQSVAGGSDLDNDGRADWLVGAPSRDATGLTNEGVVIVSTAAVQFPPPDPTGVAITAPAAAELITGSSVLVTATADNADEVEFFVNGTSIGVDQAAGPQYSVALDSTTITDGAATVTIEARNGNGGLTPGAPVIVEIDNSSPLLAITAPAVGAIVGGTVDFSAEASDPNGVASVTLSAGTTLSFTALAAPFVTDLDTTLEPDGTLSLTVAAEDNAGNVGSESLDVIVDNTPPSIAITAPADGSFVSGTISVTANASDLHLERVEITADTVLIATITDFTGAIAAQFDTTTLPDGALALEATAFDAAGNSAAAVGVVTVIDNTAPEKVFACPADGQRVRGDFLVHIEATDNGAGIASVEVFAASTFLSSSTTGTLSLPVDSRTVLDGPLALVCIVTDLAGNEHIETVTVIVDNLRFRLLPNRLHVGSCGGGSVWLSIKGSSVNLLAPISDHTVQLSYPGGFVVTALDGWSLPCYGRIFARFSRAELISAINAQFGQSPPRRLSLDVIADGQNMGKTRLRLRRWTWY